MASGDCPVVASARTDCFSSETRAIPLLTHKLLVSLGELALPDHPSKILHFVLFRNHFEHLTRTFDDRVFLAQLLHFGIRPSQKKPDPDSLPFWNFLEPLTQLWQLHNDDAKAIFVNRMLPQAVAFC